MDGKQLEKALKELAAQLKKNQELLEKVQKLLGKGKPKGLPFYCGKLQIFKTSKI